MSNIFTAPDDTGQQLADSLSQGRAWGAKNKKGSNTRELIDAVAVAHNHTQQQIELLAAEFNINNTMDLLAEWETSVGIPDTCLATSATIAQRRQTVIDKLRKKPRVTLSDLQEYVDCLFPGFGVVLIPGSEYYTFEYEFGAPFLGDIADKFVLVATVPLSDNTFDYAWEIEFEGGADTIQLECLLNKIIPANVLLIVEFTET